MEILTEDMPPSHQNAARKQIYDGLKKLLEENKISYQELRVLSTPRRLTVIIKGIQPEIPPEEELVIGPPKNVAFDSNGNPTPAATGFAKRLGIDVSELETIETEKGVYVGYRKKGESVPTWKLLEKELPSIIYSISFPKSMHWDGWRFSRRVRNLLCKFDDRILDMELFGKKANAITQGHFIFSPLWFEPENVDAYIKSLREAFVIVDNVERESIIRDALAMLEVEQKPEEEVILYWRDSTEYPNLFVGEFPARYLELPPEIIKASLVEAQKLYPIYSGGELTSRFIGVADTPTTDMGKIVAGNERVVRARLEDALYFWKEDRKVSMEKRREALKEVLYHEKAGDYYQKTERLAQLASWAASSAGVDEEAVVQAARLCKADLLTQLVGEFPSLQGIAGGLLLREEGYPEKVWKAVYEHYRPLGQEDSLPETAEGCLLSVLDKTDDLCVAFASGYRPKGGGDPLGARRAALGILRIIYEKEMEIELKALLEKALELLPPSEEDREKTLQELLDFLLTRFRVFLTSRGHRHDIVDAVLEKEGLNILTARRKIEALEKAAEKASFATIIQAYRRVANILRGVEERYELREELLQEQAEKSLAEIIATIKPEVEDLCTKGNYMKVLENLLILSPIVDELFDNVLIMAEDENIRRNRIALLQQVADIFNALVDFSKIEG